MKGKKSTQRPRCANWRQYNFSSFREDHEGCIQWRYLECFWSLFLFFRVPSRQKETHKSNATLLLLSFRNFAPFLSNAKSFHLEPKRESTCTLRLSRTKKIFCSPPFLLQKWYLPCVWNFMKASSHLFSAKTFSPRGNPPFSGRSSFLERERVSLFFPKKNLFPLIPLHSSRDTPWGKSQKKVMSHCERSIKYIQRVTRSIKSRQCLLHVTTKRPDLMWSWGCDTLTYKSERGGGRGLDGREGVDWDEWLGRSLPLSFLGRPRAKGRGDEEKTVSSFLLFPMGWAWENDRRKVEWCDWLKSIIHELFLAGMSWKLFTPYKKAMVETEKKILNHLLQVKGGIGRADPIRISTTPKAAGDIKGKWGEVTCRFILSSTNANFLLLRRGRGAD